MVVTLNVVLAALSTIGNIWLRLTDHAVVAEANPDLKKSIEKHHDVQEKVLQDIDALDVPGELKAELKIDVTKKIHAAVKMLNDNGTFKSAKDTNSTEE